MKLLLVEDDAQLVRSLMRGFSENGFACEHSPTLHAATAFLAAHLPEVVILDLGLPDGEGLELLPTLRGVNPTPALIITSARGELDQRVQGLEHGADDYLVKPFAFVELLARVRALLRRTAPRAPEVWRLADLEIDTSSRTVKRDGAALNLTPIEYDLLFRLARAQGGVVTREMLAREVWRQRAWTTSLDNAIDVHISRLRDKLAETQAAPFLQTVRGVGYCLKTPRSS